MDCNELFWNRVGHVEIENSQSGMMSFSGLDFKFRIQKIGHIYTEFDVSILGLSRETINELTVLGPEQARKLNRQVRVFAGYGDQESEIARGCIWYAKPTVPPEMWMNFKCMKFLDFKDPVQNVDPVESGKKIEDVFKRIGQILGLTPDWRATSVDKTKKITADYCFNGKRKLMIPELFAQDFGVVVYEDDGLIIAQDNPNVQMPPQHGNHELDMEHGLLGLGNIDIFGGEVTARLNDSYKLFDYVNLTSMLIPKASGKYLLTEKTLVGHFRGEEWFSKYRLLRKP